MLTSLAVMAIAGADGPEQWGRATLEMLRRDFLIAESGLYAERADKHQPAFNWGVGVMLSALNAAATHDDKYKPWLRAYADATRVYWNADGYDVLPAPKPLDRYYDDNAWMALALMDTHEILGDRKYLDWAKGALEFALRGESPDGGVFWRESDRSSRNTCSNGPTAYACHRMHVLTADASWRTKARRLVAWTRRHLEDPADGLFWDSLGNDGRLDKTKWSYNTALMLRAMQSLGQETGPQLAASRRRWLRDGRIHDPGRFAHLLVETWCACEGLRPEYTAALRAVWEARTPEGWLPPHWGDLKPAKNPELLDQAAFVRACFVVSS